MPASRPQTQGEEEENPKDIWKCKGMSPLNWCYSGDKRAGRKRRHQKHGRTRSWNNKANMGFSPFHFFLSKLWNISTASHRALPFSFPPCSDDCLSDWTAGSISTSLYVWKNSHLGEDGEKRGKADNCRKGEISRFLLRRRMCSLQLCKPICDATNCTHYTCMYSLAVWHFFFLH